MSVVTSAENKNLREEEKRGDWKDRQTDREREIEQELKGRKEKMQRQTQSELLSLTIERKELKKQNSTL